MSIRYYSKDFSVEVKARPLAKFGPKGGVKKAGFTVAQIETLQFWRHFSDEHGYPPTIREAGLHFGGITPHAVSCRCNLILRKGGMKATGKEDQSRRVVLTRLGRSLTTGKPTAVAPQRALYLQTAHGFVGSVTQERKCPCGVSHFLDSDQCACCARSQA